MKNVQPLHDRVLVRPHKAQEVSKGGIHLPRAAAEREHPASGEVLAVGSNDDFFVQVGQKILYGKYVGTEVTVNGEVLKVMREKDIMAIVDEYPT